MTSATRRTIIIAIVAFLAALAGVFIGRSLSHDRPDGASALHELLHDDLALNQQQLGRIDDLEARFAARRTALQAELRAGNARLAAAIQAEHGYGPRVTAEIDRSHRTMGELQKETLSHVFAMRAVLRPDQTGRFDQAVVKALTADAE